MLFRSDTSGGASDTAKSYTRCQNSLSAIIEFHGSGERRDLLVAPPAAFRHLQRVSRLVGHSPGEGDSAGMNISVDEFTHAFQDGAVCSERARQQQPGSFRGAESEVAQPCQPQVAALGSAARRERVSTSVWISVCAVS